MKFSVSKSPKITLYLHKIYYKMNSDQLKNLKGKLEALRGYL